MFQAARPVKLPKMMKYIAILVLILEVVLFIVAVRLLGVLATIGLILLTTFFGLWILKQQGMSNLMRQRNVQQNMNPMDIITMSVGMMAGTLLLCPGFITDIIGLLLLIPSVKQKVADYYVRKSMKGFNAAGQSQSYRQQKSSNDSKIIEGEYWKEDDDK